MTNRKLNIRLLLALAFCAVFWALVFNSCAYASNFHWSGYWTDERLVITDSRGGNVYQAQAVFDIASVSGRTVHIDGNCASACALALTRSGTTWSHRNRVTGGAVFLFHLASVNGVPSVAATRRYVYDPLPFAVKACLPPVEMWTAHYRPEQTITGIDMTRIMSGGECD